MQPVNDMFGLNGNAMLRFQVPGKFFCFVKGRLHSFRFAKLELRGEEVLDRVECGRRVRRSVVLFQDTGGCLEAVVNSRGPNLVVLTSASHSLMS